MKKWIALLLVTAWQNIIAAENNTYQVRYQDVQETKAVFATVEPTDVTFARARIQGTIDGLKVDEGDIVQRGYVLAVVIDEKQPMQIATLDAELKSLEAELDLVLIEKERIEVLIKQGVVSQAELDQISSRSRVLVNKIKSLKSEREVLVQTQAEGAVLSPSTGRVLKVFVVNGGVVQPGEQIASIALENYVLRIELPERHAQLLEDKQPVQIEMGKGQLIDAKISQIYPLIESGKVIADINVDDVGDYFVGQRVKINIPLKMSKKILIPKGAIQRRFGISFVKFKSGQEIAVQTATTYNNFVEVISGLREGDEILVYED